MQLNQQGIYFMSYETTPGAPRLPPLIKPFYHVLITLKKVSN